MRGFQTSLFLVFFVSPACANEIADDVRDVQLSIEVNMEGSGDESIAPGSSKKLTEYLSSKHNMNAPPDGIVDLHYELELVHILGIDELKQTMTALVYVDERWVDGSLSWDEKEFNGLRKTWLPMTKIWLPDVIIFNMLHHEDLLSSVRAPALIHSNGTVECSHPAVYTVSCEINIKHFPLDDQRCSLEIASWAYGEDKIRLHAHVEHSLQHYSPNEEWRLLNVTVHEQEYEHEGIMVSELRYDVSVRRKPLFYMVTLTFPSYVMCAISVVGLFARFSTTGEREERFTLGVTAILTMAVLSLVVSEKVPHSSTSVPLLVAYFLFNMVVVAAAAMTTGLIMRVHRRGRFGDEPPKWLLSIFFINVRDTARAKLLERSMSSLARIDKLAQKTNGLKIRDSIVSKMIEPTDVAQMPEDIDVLDGIERRNRIRVFRNCNGWVLLSERLDWTFMIFFIVLVTVPVIVLFMHM